MYMKVYFELLKCINDQLTRPQHASRSSAEASHLYGAAKTCRGESKVTFPHYIYRVHINRSRVTKNYIFIVQIITGMKQVIRYKPKRT